MPDIKITKLTVKTGDIYKRPCHRGTEFAVDVTHTLEDGRTIDSHVSSERKKNVMARVAREEQAISAGAMSACFNDKGEYWGTSTHYTLGAQGMVPVGA